MEDTKVVDIKEDESAVERFVAIPMSRLGVQQMDESQTIMFTALSLTESEQDNLDRLETLRKEFGDEVLFLYKVLTKRAEFMQIELDVRVRVMLTMTGLCSTPAQVIMYLSYLIYKTKHMEVKKVSWEDLAYWFPNGFFSQGDLDKLWIKPDGTTPLCDIGKCYKSMYLKIR